MSRAETLSHIRRVQQLVSHAVCNLVRRAAEHDASKLEEPEASAFERLTPMLKGTTYGTDRYRELLAELGPALSHHYEHNSHHPEHHAGGVRGMSLLDLLEMLLDWRAATERHDDGSIEKSIEANQARFGYSDELKAILHNTIAELALGSPRRGA